MGFKDGEGGFKDGEGGSRMGRGGLGRGAGLVPGGGGARTPPLSTEILHKHPPEPTWSVALSTPPPLFQIPGSSPGGSKMEAVQG